MSEKNINYEDLAQQVKKARELGDKEGQEKIQGIQKFVEDNLDLFMREALGDYKSMTCGVWVINTKKNQERINQKRIKD